ncbi:MAG: DUF87 domain-containing protein [Nanoarchaeota archaeon]|jgi:hypothetical protein|nr:DUF87 domain-containing protein [Nanoarchaeota archaeon]
MGKAKSRVNSIGNRVRSRKTAKSVAVEEIRREKVEKKIVAFLLFATAMSVSLLFLFLMSQATLEGYATYGVDSKAGDITEMTLYRKYDTAYWSGTYGLALRVPEFTEQLFGTFSASEIVRQDVFFDCIQSDMAGGNELFASTSSLIDFDLLSSGDPALVDASTGCSGKRDCAENTFDEIMNISIGGRVINNIPATHTYRWDGQNDIFDLGVLTDGTNLVYVSHISSVQKSFDVKKIVNYQMLLPIPEEGDADYFFFVDPTDECPEGGGIGENIDGTVYGFAFDESGDPLENVSIILAGIEVFTDSNGYYSLTASVTPNDYNFFAQKENYDDYFSSVTINFTNYNVEKNFTMNDFTPGLEDLILVVVSGNVSDAAGTPLAKIKIILGESVVLTDESGNYIINASLTMGEHSLVAIKEGFGNFHQTMNFTFNGQNEMVNIILEPATQAYEFETGPYTEKPQDAGVSQEIIEEIKARGEDNWISSKEINKEVRKNTFIEEEIGIYNLRRTNMNLNFQITPNLKDFVKIDKTTIAIAPDVYSDLKVTVYGTQPLGTYEGTLIISGDIDQEIPIKIKIVEKKFPVEVLLMEIDLFHNLVQPGRDLKYKLNLQNLLRDQSYEVNLEANVKDLSGETIFLTEKFDVEVDNSLTILKTFSIPENFTTGDYILEINADYLNLFSTVTSSFVTSMPIYLYSFFGVPLWIVFSIISFLSFASLNLFMYRRFQNKKKRYQIQVDYDTLPNPGARTVRLGNVAETKKPAYYEIDKLTTHAIVAGATGMGKSISAQVVIEEALMNDVAVIVFDPTAQWSGMLRKCEDKKMMAYYPKFGMKPQDARAFKGNVRMIKDAKQKIDISKHVAPGQIQIFSMNKLTPAEIDIFVSNVIKQIFRSDPKEFPQLKTLFVFDEVHRLLPKFGGSGAGFLQIERSCREFRKWGLGVMLISQVLNDFAGQIKANINTELQTRTLEEGDLERIRTKYGEDFLKSLVRAEVGVIMFQNADYNRGRPYFVNFRPILHSTRRLTDEELEKYNKFNEIVDELEFQIEELDKLKVDTFDLKMELKLVKDKVMSGSFSVVEIYLEGLAPRVAKEWDKLGQPAPKKELELIDDAEMAEEEAKTAKEKADAEAKEKLEKAAAEAVPKETKPEEKKE